MSIEFEHGDEIGPEKIVEIYDPATTLRSIVVIDNVSAGPAIGGLRMASDVTREECVRLARAMTLKNAAARLPHGGAKSVIRADSHIDASAKERLIRSFAHATTTLTDYIVGPDMGTNETAMAWIRDVTHRAVGLPRELGGIPLDEIGATGYGLCAALEAAEAQRLITLDGARVVVQGFGSVGKFAALFLSHKGAKLIGVCDSEGARVCPNGFDVHELIAFKESGNSVTHFDSGDPAADVLDIECDIWIPAARPDVLHRDNAARLRAKIVAQGANIPATYDAEKLLAERGVIVLPDFIANAGGVICAAVEYAGGSQASAMQTIRETIYANTEELLERSVKDAVTPRSVALEMARERVLTAMTFRKTY